MNWTQFLTQHDIPFYTRGPNVASGAIAIRCPFCGQADPSAHLNIKLRGNAWWCWRNKQHHGKRPARLIQALLNCSYEYAQQLSGDSAEITDNFLARIKQSSIAAVAKPAITLPPEFLPFPNRPSARAFYQYLANRDFPKSGFDRVAARFDIRYCTRGPYKGRIIFPIVYKGQLVSWTGRTIYPVEQRRYKVLSHDPEKAKKEGYAPAIDVNTNYLLFYDDLLSVDADTIFLCEGPFDALRLWTHNYPATCFFTASPSQRQIELLHEILPQFRHRYLLLDRGTMSTSARVSFSLGAIGVKPLQLPIGVKDPGEIDKDQLKKLLDCAKAPH